MILPANIQDASELTALAMASKSFWGYSKDLINSWKNDLTVTSKMIERMDIYKYIIDNKTVGFYALNPPRNNSVELELLFISPEIIGKGIGKTLLLHSFNLVKKNRITSMTLLADPNAVPFYKSQGFKIIDKKESSIPNRFLPIMKKEF
ncbi:GNAT family N-acetyltransferase [Tenacibaculum sp.]|nr:GNAT family N-acetyltransferase [Tenacibaculum sp.]